MIKKIVNYYKSFGFNELLKKITRYIIFSCKSTFADNGVYQMGKNEKKNITLKYKKVYILTYYNYTNVDIQVKELMKNLNQLGFQILYICIEKKSKEKLLPLSFYKNIKKININSFKIGEKDIIIFDGYYKEFEILYNETKKNHCKKIFIKDDSFQNSIINSDSNLIEVKKENCLKEICQISFKEKCDNKFFNNISIIVLNYNNKGIIEKCINSLLKNNHRYNYEVIVVDNQSNDGSYELLQKKYKNIKLYCNSKNGCSSGRNIGVFNSKKDYILFLDSDQWILNPYWLDNYIEILRKDPTIGAVGWAGGWFNKKGYAYHTFENFEYRYMPPQGLYRKDIGYLGSGGLMISKNLFQKIDGFDINYDPTCYEDTDISLKIRHYGKEIVYCPYLGIMHKPHQTTKSGSIEHDKLIKKNGLYFVNKWKKIDLKLLNYYK